MDLRDRLQSALGDAYRLDRELGGGGMSRVFSAIETSLGRTVVIKTLPPGLTAGLSAERFRREIRLLANMSHPNIVPILSAGDREGLLYYMMPYIAGETLRHRMQKESPLPIDEAVAIAIEIAEALDYAHRQGIVHRDIKPENIFLIRQGEDMDFAKILDFGIAKPISGELSDDGVRLWINGQRLIAAPSAQSFTVGRGLPTAPGDTGVINLTAGQTYPFMVEYGQGTGGAGAASRGGEHRSSGDNGALCADTSSDVHRLHPLGGGVGYLSRCRGERCHRCGHHNKCSLLGGIGGCASPVNIRSGIRRV